jgi:predicted nucleic acid-binding protein
LEACSEIESDGRKRPRDLSHVWGRLRVPNPDNPLDKQIAATALIHDLTVVTRNTEHFAPTGARLLNPFA